MWCPYFEFDLESLSLLPPSWDRTIEAVGARSGVVTVLKGLSMTSRERVPNPEIPVTVANGEVIRREIGWLYDLYEKPLCDIASKAFGRELFPAADEKSAININVIAGAGARYEWHVDSNPVTGLLFANTLPPDCGGELLFRQQNQECLVRPRKGVFLLFDAREIEHTVVSLKTQCTRISVPMNYYFSPNPADQHRPKDLDDYLYGNRRQ